MPSPKPIIAFEQYLADADEQTDLARNNGYSPLVAAKNAEIREHIALWGTTVEGTVREIGGKDEYWHEYWDEGDYQYEWEYFRGRTKE